MPGSVRNRVYVHVGAPKTGTTYLQDRLALNRRSLAEHDVHYPTPSPVADPSTFQFRAALDLLGHDWGGDPGHAAGSWDRFVRLARRRTGSVILTHEILATAKPWVIERFRSSLADHEIHVVYTARDLARQVPAAWQESIKQGRRWRYRRFLRKMQNGGSWFARAFDLPNVLSRWGEGLPPERIHLVTVPAQDSGADRDELWRRMCRALGVEPAWAPRDSSRLNRSMGMAETQVLRRLNIELGTAPRQSDNEYTDVVRGMLAENLLVGRADSTPVRLPPQMYAWAAEQTERWVEWVEQSGIDVVGSLDDLKVGSPDPGATPSSNPDRIPNREQLEVAVHALAAMTHEAMRRRNPDQTVLSQVRTGLERLTDR